MPTSVATAAFLALFALPCAISRADDVRADILVNDFEAADYGEWSAEGDAFGPGPARGTLPGQMPVSGFEGERLINTFFEGDASTGTLTSSPVRIERRYLNFLIGGGGHRGETCMNLLHEGNVVRTATGSNTAAGGSEALEWRTWDVHDLQGENIVLQIVDRHTGGWGHINVDHIVQSDRKQEQAPVQRDLAITAQYLHLPVKTGAPPRRMRLDAEGRTVREFEIELAEEEPDFWVFTDVDDWIGQTLTLHADRLPPESAALDAVSQSDELPREDELYTEPLRPQFHFTSRRGWLNDPNGLVFHNGRWHLFYQHNPYGWNWGNMHWGHAVSSDLFHWKELGEAIYPRQFGDWAFSGSAVVDHHDTSGMQTGDEPVLAAFYTSTGRGECVVFSHDGGDTWTEYAGNPVVRHPGRDPKVVWHEPAQRWVMAVYTEPDGQRQIAFYTSADLKAWEFASRIDGFFECPDLFELPVDGDDSRTRWVLYAADGRYVLGDFDGREFRPESGKHQLWHGNFYAAQTYDNAPDGRRVQIGWGQGITFPGMPFNQQMVVPVDLTLRSTPDGIRMFAEPVPELLALRGEEFEIDEHELADESRTIEGPAGGLFDIELIAESADSGAVGLRIGEHSVVIDSSGRDDPASRTRSLRCGNVAVPIPATGSVRLRVLVDRGSIEVFVNDGALALSVGTLVPADHPPLELFATGAPATISGTVHKLNSIWID